MVAPVQLDEQIDGSQQGSHNGGLVGPESTEGAKMGRRINLFSLSHTHSPGSRFSPANGHDVCGHSPRDVDKHQTTARHHRKELSGGLLLKDFEHPEPPSQEIDEHPHEPQ